MKKGIMFIFCLILVVSMMFALSACGSKDEAPQPTPSQEMAVTEREIDMEINDRDDSLGENDPDENQAEGEGGLELEKEPIASVVVDRDLTDVRGSTNDGDAEDPVQLGTIYFWNEQRTGDYGFNAEFGLVVHDVRALSRQDLDDMQIAILADDSVGYVMVELTYMVNNLDMKSAEPMFMSMVSPSFWGSRELRNGRYIGSIIGSMDYGFDGSLSRARDDYHNFEKQATGDPISSHQITGSIIVPITADADVNAFVIQNMTNGMDYEPSFMYFLLR